MSLKENKVWNHHHPSPAGVELRPLRPPVFFTFFHICVKQSSKMQPESFFFFLSQMTTNRGLHALACTVESFSNQSQWGIRGRESIIKDQWWESEFLFLTLQSILRSCKLKPPPVGLKPAPPAFVAGFKGHATWKLWMWVRCFVLCCSLSFNTGTLESHKCTRAQTHTNPTPSSVLARKLLLAEGLEFWFTTVISLWILKQVAIYVHFCVLFTSDQLLTCM